MKAIKNMWKGFTSAWGQFFRLMFKAKGKTGRAKYMCVIIPILLSILLFLTLAGLLVEKQNPQVVRVTGYYLLYFYLPYNLIVKILSFCLVARRNHDIGVNKWFALIMFIPNIGIVYLVILMVISSHFQMLIHPHKYLQG
ncbi:DUF805 domain-containing protein [Acetilactobacillus jinshanensis]|uniref:DUF805 domain-containing protein n=1 Tax=Acetilactobacillus jinshanensis TaxID=1720083 RepID=A0A4P6ZME6_9LACO|nr:DUF805 domain-containing protein [Acetilactobacillus jinshanensis]QBP18410.1 DUF805 domain-containing protein [Acetilactobacillus jinshanensis]URL61281.1 DUF805 domain-containing protein [uncultured bacterium]